MNITTYEFALTRVRIAGEQRHKEIVIISFVSVVKKQYANQNTLAHDVHSSAGAFFGTGVDLESQSNEPSFLKVDIKMFRIPCWDRKIAEED